MDIARRLSTTRNPLRPGRTMCPDCKFLDHAGGPFLGLSYNFPHHYAHAVAHWCTEGDHVSRFDPLEIVEGDHALPRRGVAYMNVYHHFSRCWRTDWSRAAARMSPNGNVPKRS